MHLVCALTISTLFIIYILVYSQPIYQEGFYGNFPGPKYCGDCNQIWDINKCMSCNNCGWCVDPNGNGSCGYGSINGPLFKDCRSWFYNGKCIWGPDCGYSGPIYYDNEILNYPWYSRWFN